MSQTDSKKHVCVLCNTKLESKEDLQEHFRKHANKEIDSKGRPWKPGPTLAKSSKQSSVNRNNVGKPTTTPNKAGDIVCDVCGQGFESVTIAIQHKFRKHPESAVKHFCPYCGMQFPLKINRDKHMTEHPSGTPSKLFPCSDCGVVFYSQEAQTYHAKSTHKRIVALFKPVATPPPSKKIKVNNAGEAQSVYYCHLCGFEYIVKFNLQKHLERQHGEQDRNRVPEDLIKCITCDALFYNKRAYENHNMYHKPDDLYVTSEEQRLQTVTRVDQDFDIRRVQTAAEKFIPIYRHRAPSQKKRKRGRAQRERKEESNDELSPDSSPDSSDTDSDTPLRDRLNSKRHNVASGEKVYAKHKKKNDGTNPTSGRSLPDSLLMKDKTNSGSPVSLPEFLPVNVEINEDSSTIEFDTLGTEGDIRSYSPKLNTTKSEIDPLDSSTNCNKTSKANDHETSVPHENSSVKSEDSSTIDVKKEVQLTKGCSVSSSHNRKSSLRAKKVNKKKVKKAVGLSDS